MKTRISLLLGILAAAQPAAGLVNLGEGRIDLTVASSLHHDSRITARAGAPSDTVFNLTPSLVYTRPSKHFDLRLGAGLIIDRYFDNSEFDDENFFFDLAINPDVEMRTSRFTFTGDLILRSDTRSEEDIGRIVSTRTYGVNGQLTYDPNPRYNVIVTAGANREDPDDDDLNRIDRFSTGATLQLAAGKERFANLGSSYEKTQQDGAGLDSEVLAAFAGLSGTLTPKLQGSVSAGIQQRSLEDGDDTTAPFFSAGLTWRQSETTQFSLTASNRFDTTLGSYNTESFNAQLGWQRQMSRDWSTGAAVGYVKSDYQSLVLADRSDEELFGSLQVTRQLVRWGSLSADVRYSDRSSDVAEFDYSRLRYGITFRGKW